MNVKDFGKIIPDEVVALLKQSIYKIDTPRNYWVGIDDTPKNNLELFTFKSLDILHPSIPREQICGFEWWYHIGKTIRGVNPHFDCDEHKKMNEKIISTPLGCSINYLTDSPEAPTIITNVEPDWHRDSRFYAPTQTVYSFPGVGKSLTFSPKYLHGIKTASLKTDRITLMCNVWNYRPKETVRVSLVEELVEFELLPRVPSPPTPYSNETEPFQFDYFGGGACLRCPKEFQAGDTLLLTAEGAYGPNRVL